MTYFPTNVMKNILAFCDDGIEREQKKAHIKCVEKINRFDSNWYEEYCHNTHIYDYCYGQPYEAVYEEYIQLIRDEPFFGRRTTFKEYSTCDNVRNILFDESL